MDATNPPMSILLTPSSSLTTLPPSSPSASQSQTPDAPPDQPSSPSTLSNSLPAVSSHSPQPIKRSRRTYGRKVADTSALEHDAEHGASLGFGHSPRDKKVSPPTGDENEVDEHSRTLINSDEDLAEDDSADHASLNSYRDFGSWKLKLQALDGDDHVTIPIPPTKSPNARRHGMGSRSPSPVALSTKEPTSSDRCKSLLVSLAESPSNRPSNDSRKRSRTAQNLELDSDEEQRESSPTKQKLFSTPTSRLTPTPPTSESGHRGKATAHPIHFPAHDSTTQSDDAESSVAVAKDTRKKTKAPTKKELKESTKETARLFADQDVSIARHIHAAIPLSEWVTRASANVTTVTKERGLPLPPTSDPIQTFSSPQKAANATGVAVAKHRLGDVKLHAKSSSEEDEPITAAQLLEEHKQKVARRAQQERLALLKQQALEQSKKKATRSRDEARTHESDEDDLIFEDVVRDGITTSSPSSKFSQYRSKHLDLAHVRSASRPEYTSNTQLSVQSAFASSSGKKRRDNNMRPEQVQSAVLARAKNQAAKIKGEKEREWVALGGSLKVDLGLSFRGRETEVERSESDDGEWELPEDREGSQEAGSPPNDDEMVEPTGSTDEDESYNQPVRRHRRARQQVVQSDDEDQMKQLTSRGRILVAESSILGDVVVKDAFNSEDLPRRRSLSTGSRTSDPEEADKENDQALVYEDKENTSIARGHSFDSFPHSPASPSRFATHPACSPSRHPFQPLRADADDVFGLDEDNISLRPPLLRRSTSFVLHKEVSERDSICPLQPGFSQFFDGATQATSGLDLEDVDGLANLRRSREADDMPLSASLETPAPLEPAFEVSQNVRRRAADIFQKEQEFVIEAAREQTESGSESDLYVKDDGFLTQTRPENDTFEVYHPPVSYVTADLAPTQRTASDFSALQARSERMPLRTLSFTFKPDTPTNRSPKRLRRRSTTPSPIGNSRKLAPLFLSKSTGETRQRLNPRSNFVEDAAEVSDEETGWGFDHRHRRQEDDEENENNENLDGVVPELLDDTRMDVEALAEDRVLEKVREHQEEDDAENERIHQAAIEGKFRTKRSRHGLNLDDDSSDEEDYDLEDKRRKFNKKRKIDSEKLEDLARHTETRPFYDAYQQDLQDNDMICMTESFQNVPEAEQGDNDDGAAEARDNTADSSNIREQLRRVAEREGPIDLEQLNRQIWVNGHDEDELFVSTRDIGFRSNRAGRTDSANLEGGWMTKRGPRNDETHLTSWAKEERPRARNVFGKAGGAVTGLIEKKGGGRATTKPVRDSVQPLTRPLAKSASILSAVSDKQHGFEV